MMRAEMPRLKARDRRGQDKRDKATNSLRRSVLQALGRSLAAAGTVQSEKRANALSRAVCSRRSQGLRMNRLAGRKGLGRATQNLLVGAEVSRHRSVLALTMRQSRWSFCALED